MATRAAKVGTKRPWRTLVVPWGHDEWVVAQEVPDDLGIELWLLLRQVLLWSVTPRARRHRLFRRKRIREEEHHRRAILATAPYPPLRSAMALLMRITGRTPPDEGELSSACRTISEWAKENGHLRTTLLFAEAAARVDTADPYASFYAARAHRLGGDTWRAEAYYQRAIRLAYRCQRWSIYVRAHLGAGRVMLQRLHAWRGRTWTRWHEQRGPESLGPV